MAEAKNGFSILDTYLPEHGRIELRITKGDLWFPLSIAAKIMGYSTGSIPTDTRNKISKSNCITMIGKNGQYSGRLFVNSIGFREFSKPLSNIAGFKKKQLKAIEFAEFLEGEKSKVHISEDNKITAKKLIPVNKQPNKDKQIAFLAKELAGRCTSQKMRDPNFWIEYSKKVS